MSSEKKLEGKVAFHRWFAEGEGWVCHPWYDQNGREVLSVLNNKLNSSQEGDFCEVALGGVLVGESCPDQHCLDPKARDRHPSLFRVAFVPHQLDDKGRQAAREALRALPCPEHAGEDAELIIEISIPPEPHGPRVAGANLLSSVPTSKRISWVLVAALTGIMSLMVLVYWSFPQPTAEQPAAATHTARVPSDIPHQTPPKKQPGRSEVEEQLRRYQDVDHPYLAFLRAYPPSGDHSRDSRLSYESWLEDNEHQKFVDRNKPLPQEIRREVEQYRKPNRDFKDAAKKMAKLLRGWQKQPEPSEQCAERCPFKVFDLFFAYLVRPGTLPRPWKLDHPQNVFLWRLPRDPVAEGLTFDHADDLEKPLRRLLADLQGVETSNLEKLSCEDLLHKIESEMNYQTWRERQAEHYSADEKNDLDDEVKKGIQPFINANRR